jgi:hypothetical protein
MPPSDSRKLSDWLHRQTGATQRALDRAEQLVQVNRAFREWLGEAWSSDVRIAAIEGDTAVVYAAHAAAATLLRFRAPSIVGFVRERYNPACTDLQIKVQPETYAAN